MNELFQNKEFWREKLAAFLHDPPDKALDIGGHEKAATSHQKGLIIDTGEEIDFSKACDETAASADRLPWPKAGIIKSRFDGKKNHFKHPLGRGLLITEQLDPTSIHEILKDLNPVLTQPDNPGLQFLTVWRVWRWWASEQNPSISHLPAETRIPDHTIWCHNAIVSALQSCVIETPEGKKCLPAFLLFQIGPVQDYIAQARRTLDLWSGSYLLSYLIGYGLKHIALTFGPDCIIYPNLYGQPIIDLLLKDEVWSEVSIHEKYVSDKKTVWDSFGYVSDSDPTVKMLGRRQLLTPTLPNRFLAVLPRDKASATAQEVEKIIREKYRQIAEKVWDWACTHLGAANCWTSQNKERYMHQVERFLEIYWCVLPWPETVQELKELARIIPRSEQINPAEGFETICKIAKAIPKEERDERYYCSSTDSTLDDYCGLKNPGVGWSLLYQVADWLLRGVKLTRPWQAWAATGWKFGRSFNKDSLNGKEEAILDLTGAPRLAEELNKAANIPHLFKEGELLGATSLIKRLWPTAWLADPGVHAEGRDNNRPLFDRKVFAMPDTREIAVGKCFGDESANDSNSESGYFAVLVLDGDEMGKWVSGLHPSMPSLLSQLSDYEEDGTRKGARVYFENLFEVNKIPFDTRRPLNPSFHLQFSEMIANFANYCVQRIVEAFNGRVIYAGGDDVVALLPAATAINCAVALRGGFRGDPKILNNLTGAWFYNNNNWEKKLIRLFDTQYEGFIRIHEKAPATEVEPKKFHVLVPGPAADCSVGIAIAHHTHPLQQVVQEAQQAVKRAKSDFGRSAIAITLLKRSGETVVWGCKWNSGGIEALNSLLDAITNTKAISSRFPHRVCQIVKKYLTVEGSHQHPNLKIATEFAEKATEVLKHELEFLLSRHKNPTAPDEAVQNVLQSLLQYIEKTANSKSEKDTPNTRAEKLLKGVFGLCQTAAFLARSGYLLSTPSLAHYNVSKRV